MRACLLRVAIAAMVFLGQAYGACSAQDLLDRGLGFGRAGDLDAAEREFLEGRRRFPGDARFAQELAGIAYRRKSFGAAKAYLHSALRTDAEDHYSNDFLGSLYLLDGNLPSALRYWNRIGKPVLGDVRFAPEPPLKPLFRQRAFDVSGGQVFTYERLLRTEANLDLLEAFSDCRFDLAPGTGDRADLMVRPVPLGPPLRGWAGYAISALRGLPYQELHLDFYNLGKHATNILFLWRWDAQKRRIGIEVSGPMHLWRYRLGVDAREENWDLRGTYIRAGAVSGLGLRRLGANASLTRDLTARLKWTVGLDVAVRDFRGADASAFFAHGWSAEVRNRFDYLLFDWPERRLQVDAWTELRTGRMLTRFPSRLVGVESGAGAHWKPMARTEKYSVAAEMRSGVLFGNATLDELFTLGMERDNDLWLRGHVGTLFAFRRRYGVGRAIAAPQIGVAKRLIYLETDRAIAFFNPVLEFPDDEKMTLLDDCMSFPNLLVRVERYRRCVVRYLDLDWTQRVVELEGDLSELIQHEYDHLNGVLATMRAVDKRSFFIKTPAAGVTV